MAKSEGQKLKLLYILKYLQEHTDEEHPITTAELLSRLQADGISCERKTIYSDIAALVDFGYDIIQLSNRRGGGYYLASREFELAELKLLVDVVQSSRFISTKKSRSLIKKLEQMAGKHDAGKLQRQVYVAGRIKTENESIYYNVDTLHRAIQENKQICFQYLEWNLAKKLVQRGDLRKVSPWALIWREENYYLVAYDDEAGILKHYRVDKMGDMEILDVKREGKAEFKQENIAAYSNKSFGMFGGEEEIVTMEFSERLVGVVLDRFGKDVELRAMEDGTFRIRVQVAVSGQFFGWLAGIGAEAKIVAPEKIKSRYTEWLQNIIKSNQ